jgi:hypothetical protein
LRISFEGVVKSITLKSSAFKISISPEQERGKIKINKKSKRKKTLIFWNIKF